MRQVFYVASKELRSYFVTPVAYLVVAFWFALVSLFFFFSVAGQDASLTNVFGVMTIILLFAIPVLTMRLLSEETRTGTLELLMTAPVKDWAVVLGKYLGVLGLYFVMLVLTLFYPLMIMLYKGSPDWGPIWSGYLGLFLFGMVALAIGLFTSSLTSNQIASGFIGLVLLVALYVIGNLASSLSAELGDFFHNISISERLSPFERGVVDLRDILFYLVFSALMVFLTVQVVDARRYRS